MRLLLLLLLLEVGVMMVGIYIGLLSSLATVIVSVMNKKIVAGYMPQVITLYQLTGGFLGLTILMPMYNFLLDSSIQFPVKWDWVWLPIQPFSATQS